MERNHRVVFRAVLLVGFCWFLLFAGLNSRGATRQDGLSVNNVSKRQVPNGSDPIHNRQLDAFACFKRAYFVSYLHRFCMFPGERETQDNLLIDHKEARQCFLSILEVNMLV
ncbi:hypothetical protein R6Q57_014054 [Mikania cordata]